MRGVAVAVLALLLFAPLRVLGAKPETLRYALCKQNVASVEAVPVGSGGVAFGIALQLKRDATRELERLTEEHVGSVLEVAFARWLFLSVPIERRLRSGLLISASFSSEAQVEGAIGQLRAQLPEAPCGLVVSTPASAPAR
jgi:hypothetical protein